MTSVGDGQVIVLLISSMIGLAMALSSALKIRRQSREGEFEVVEAHRDQIAAEVASLGRYLSVYSGDPATGATPVATAPVAPDGTVAFTDLGGAMITHIDARVHEELAAKVRGPQPVSMTDAPEEVILRTEHVEIRSRSPFAGHPVPDPGGTFTISGVPHSYPRTSTTWAANTDGWHWCAYCETNRPPTSMKWSPDAEFMCAVCREKLIARGAAQAAWLARKVSSERSPRVFPPKDPFPEGPVVTWTESDCRPAHAPRWVDDSGVETVRG